MKILGWLLFAGLALGEEAIQLPIPLGKVTTRDGREYEQASITGYDAVGIKLTHAGGVARIEFARLPKEIVDRFPRNAEAAKQQLQKEARQASEHERSMEQQLLDQEKSKTPPKAGGDAQATDSADDDASTETGPVESAPDLKGDPTQKVAALRSYISRLRIGIEAAQKEVDRHEKAAKRYVISAHYSVEKENGLYLSKTNESLIKKADARAARARKEKDKIAHAQRLIDDSMVQINELLGIKTP